MNQGNNFALVPKPPSAVENVAPGAKRILSDMIADTLALRKNTPLSAKKFRIGDDAWCEPDYRQILIWARALALAPAEITLRLQNGSKDTGFNAWGETRFCNGRLEKINWDFALLPMVHFEWVEELETTHLSFENTWQSPNRQPINIALPNLTHLHCRKAVNLINTPRLKYLNCSSFECYLDVELDLSKVPHLERLECGSAGWPFHNLSSLNLSAVPQLTHLSCGRNKISFLDLRNKSNLKVLNCGANNLSHLDLSGVPNLIILRCWENKIENLDLNLVPHLEELVCQDNPMNILDITPLHKLRILKYNADKVRLVQRPDQHF